MIKVQLPPSSNVSAISIAPITGSAIANTTYVTDWATMTNTMTVKGDLSVPNGDIKLGDQSLKEFMDQVSQRLGILRPNPKLEEQWEELRELAQRYRALEQEILAKEQVWESLKRDY